MAEIIFNAEFVKTEYAGNSCKNIKKQINTDEMVDYYERKEACDYTVDENEDDDTYQINSQDAFNYYDYRIGSTGGFNRNGNFEKGEANRLMEKYQPKILWRFVFSFEKEFAQNSNIITKTNMQKLMTKSMEKNIRALGFDPQNVEWGAYYHTNTDNPHCHVWIFEKEPTKRYYKISKKKFNKVRSNVIRTMVLNSEIYIERDNLKEELLNCIKNDELIKLFKSSKNNSKKCFKKNNGIINLLLDLNDKLPLNGSLKYNSKNIRPYHDDIDKIVDIILNTNNVKLFYCKYKKHLQKEKEMFNNRYFSDEEKMEQNRSFENKDKELRTRIANMVLQNIKNYRLDNEHYSKLENKIKKETIKTSAKKHSYINKFSAVNASKHSMSCRSSLLQAGILDELSKAIMESSNASRIIEKELDDMVKKAQKEIRANSFEHSL